MTSKLLVSRLENLRLSIQPNRTWVNIVSCPAKHIDETTSEVSWDNAIPYKKIPGPKSLPIFGNILRFLPYIGEYGNMPLSQQMHVLHNQYGDIVRLDGVPNRRQTVFLFDPDLCERMYRTEGPWPLRISLETMRLYRERFMKTTYKGRVGLVSSQGREWHEFRSNVNQHMMVPRSIKPHVGQVSEVATDFITRIRQLRDPKTLKLPATFNNEMNKWALESICMIALDHRLGALDDNLPENSEPQQMINAVHDLFECLYQLEILPSLWQLYDTPYLKKLFHVLDTINRISRKHIDNAKIRFDKNPTTDVNNRCVLESLLNIDVNTAYVMAIDMLTAGIDTSANAAGNLLYYLAKNSRVQEKLRNEIFSLQPDSLSHNVTYNMLNQLTYLKACVKETLRISSIAIGNLRTTQNNIVVGGYQIPKGVDLVACHSVLAVSPKQFSREKEFLPERWMRDNDNTLVNSSKEAHRFAYMPFGFGPRMCIGRRFAELEMEILVIKMLQNFKIEWPFDKPLEIKSRFINTIHSPLQLKLTDI